MGQHQLHLVATIGAAEVADLRVHRCTLGRRGPLLVGEGWLADVPERDGLGVGERLDRRVLALALTRPRAEEPADRLEVGVQWRAHAPEPPTIPPAMSAPG